MDLKALVRLFDEAFRIEVPGVAGGKVFRAERPVEMPAALEAIVQTEADRTAIEDDWMAALGEGAVNPALAFEWEGVAGSFASIDLLTLGGNRTYIGWNAEWQYYVIAALNRLDALPDMVTKLLAENGALCGTEMFGGLPSRTINTMPDALPKDAVRKGYHEWARWAAATGLEIQPREVGEMLFDQSYRETAVSHRSPPEGE